MISYDVQSKQQMNDNDYNNGNDNSETNQKQVPQTIAQIRITAITLVH